MKRADRRVLYHIKFYSDSRSTDVDLQIYSDNTYECTISDKELRGVIGKIISDTEQESKEAAQKLKSANGKLGCLKDIEEELEKSAEKQSTYEYAIRRSNEIKNGKG